MYDENMQYQTEVDNEVDGLDSHYFVEKELYPALQEIIHAYQNGTDFSIYMEEDGLIHAGSGLDQVTWMDVRVGDWVATPRHGKPVEINALWYNALMVMSELAEQYHDDAPRIGILRAPSASPFWKSSGMKLTNVCMMW